MGERQTEPRVSYTVREMFQRIETRLDELAERLDDRVTVEVFRGLGKDVLALALRISDLEAWKKEREASETARRKYATGLWLWVRRGLAFGGWVAAFTLTLLTAMGVFR